MTEPSGQVTRSSAPISAPRRCSTRTSVAVVPAANARRAMWTYFILRQKSFGTRNLCNDANLTVCMFCRKSANLRGAKQKPRKFSGLHVFVHVGVLDLN
jgi:hypothetical protein